MPHFTSGFSLPLFLKNLDSTLNINGLNLFFGFAGTGEICKKIQGFSALTCGHCSEYRFHGFGLNMLNHEK